MSKQPPNTNDVERVIKGIIGVRCLKVRARKSSCKKEMFITPRRCQGGNNIWR
ncbi:hypothetical protein PILCRDRAFT_825807 [Piloderma croceum F 1598]|uniref:Uncharacterized protein n=1 Tax=Piloderma croceum (strain F 1598) TaxID=765440 RepID=A0A0C3ASW7_PILCF|nr:hypothetical protein PILCRDRAFT_825807 [Piloderma croceum F 1598]